MSDLVSYVANAIDRIGGAAPRILEASHRAGVFNKAASGFESRMAAYAVVVTGDSRLIRRTLGQLIAVLEDTPGAGAEPLRTTIAEAKRANEAWILVKHGREPGDEDLLNGLRGIQAALKSLPPDKT